MSAKKIIPLFDRVLIQRVKAQTATASGILIPQSAQTALNEGLVVSTGPGLTNETGTLVPLGVKTGERVLLPPCRLNAVCVWC